MPDWKGRPEIKQFLPSPCRWKALFLKQNVLPEKIRQYFLSWDLLYRFGCIIELHQCQTLLIFIQGPMIILFAIFSRVYVYSLSYVYSRLKIWYGWLQKGLRFRFNSIIKVGIYNVHNKPEWIWFKPNVVSGLAPRVQIWVKLDRVWSSGQNNRV